MSARGYYEADIDGSAAVWLCCICWEVIKQGDMYTSYRLIHDGRPWWMLPAAFLSWWYGQACKQVLFFALFIIAATEDIFAVLTMLKAIVTLQPLHQDYSLVGRGIGVVFRLGWVSIGIVLVAVSICLAMAVLLVWLALPLLCIWGMWQTIVYTV